MSKKDLLNYIETQSQSADTLKKNRIKEFIPQDKNLAVTIEYLQRKVGWSKFEILNAIDRLREDVPVLETKEYEKTPKMYWIAENAEQILDYIDVLHEEKEKIAGRIFRLSGFIRV